MVDRSGTFVKGRGEKNFRPPPFQGAVGYGTLTPGDYIMIRIQNIPLPIGGDLELLRRRAAKALGVRPGALEDLILVRQSIDARKKQDVHYVYTVDVSLRSGEEQAVERAGKKNIALVTPKPYVFPEVKRRSGTMPVVVGDGAGGAVCRPVPGPERHSLRGAGAGRGRGCPHRQGGGLLGRGSAGPRLQRAVRGGGRGHLLRRKN